MKNSNVNIIQLQDRMMGKCCCCCYVKIYSSKKKRCNTSQMEKYLFEPVVLVGRLKVQAVELWRPAMLPGSQPEDKAFSELLAPNILGVTACMLIFNVFCVYAWSISFRTQIFRVNSVVRSMTEASFLTSLLSGGLVSCWCSLCLSFNSNKQELECGNISWHMLFSWRRCSIFPCLWIKFWAVWNLEV